VTPVADLVVRDGATSGAVFRRPVPGDLPGPRRTVGAGSGIILRMPRMLSPSQSEVSDRLSVAASCLAASCRASEICRVVGIIMVMFFRGNSVFPKCLAIGNCRNEIFWKKSEEFFLNRTMGRNRC
jgi:hypothetical protein